MTIPAAFPPLRLSRRLAALITVLATVCAHAHAQQDGGQDVASPAPAPPAQSAKPTQAVADFNTCAKPVYPRASLRAEQVGTVMLAFLIGSDGAVKDAKVVKSSGFPLLDMAAQDGVRRCKFKPSRVDGQAVEAWMKMQYVWSLGGPDPAHAAAALAAARAGAERGEPASQHRLGSIYMDGAGIARNRAEAAAWWRKAAEQGYVPAYLSLGMASQTGYGAEPDPAQAMTWFRKAADHGMPAAQHMLGFMLVGGAGVPGDKEAAREMFRKAAAQGWAPSQAYYGMMLLEDKVPDSLEQGLALLRKAAAQGDNTGQFFLARCHETGHGVPLDLAKAAALYETAAFGGNTPLP
ncbi:TonB family protein [Massilia sp. CCM 9210]|uniref:TonB family protein n=1 Tax=Massilia scottii TaxID=3057166 RepID=UPI002796B592|nr:TonB family protein [Massilia sp. CCM 9210]MDQ1812454.1 TonB family protein [Massilia sp. CCM 9210]